MIKREDSEQFTVPEDIQARAAVRNAPIRVTTKEVMQQMVFADHALNGDSNDDEHDALFALREWLSEVFEDPDRRIQ